MASASVTPSLIMSASGATWDYYRLGGNADADVNLWSVSVQYLF